MEKLTKNEISESLKKLKDWKLKGSSIVKMFKTKGFPQTMGLASAIGALCQAHDHHPDYLTMKYDSIEVSFSSHDVKGLSSRDIKIAKEIDKLKF
ncbi:MAG: 4a-hydroxytetrahydrobiopterin dehydratase [Bacteroidetes bacterium]|nr:4a-hydroxytetrahydrobiopterin dehydratase [Bacteroidota bacterium]